jgi:hypothetical protein
MFGVVDRGGAAETLAGAGDQNRAVFQNIGGGV